jgi:hypothetical protein
MAQDLALNAVEAAQAQLTLNKSEIVAVTRQKFGTLAAKFPPLTELYVTARIDLDYVNQDPAQVQGAVGLYLQLVDGKQLFGRPWSLFTSSNDPAAILSAIEAALSVQMRDLANAVSH